jgi:hypothetical protein
MIFSLDFLKKIVVSSISVLALILFVFSAHTTFGAYNPQINYQGKLVDNLGVTVADGDYGMVFNLYTTETGGVSIWTEDRSTAPGDRVNITNGLFSIMLGSSTPLTSVDFNQTLYLGVDVEGDGEMSPRKIFGAVPAAFVADSLDGFSSGQFFRNDTTNSTSTASTFLAVTQSGAGDIANFVGQGAQSVLLLTSAGNVGIGTTSPYAKLSVAGQTVAQYFTSTSTTIANTFPLASTTVLSVSTAAYFPNSSIWNSTGLGIGTTSPAVALSVVGSGYISSTFGIGTTTPAATFATEGSGYFSSNLFVGGTITSTSSQASTLPYASTTVISASTSAYFATSGTGNVGIGTTSPYAKLSVVGQTVSEYFTSTSTSLASTFPLASTTVISASSSAYFATSGTGSVGIGATTTPWAMLSVNADGITGPSFAIGSSTATHVVVSNTGLVGIGTSTPFAQLSVVGGMAQPQFVVATTTGASPLFYINSTTTGALDYARVGIGTTTMGAAGGLLDQLTVSGRIYSTWRELRCDAFGVSNVAATGGTTDVSHVCGPFALDADADGQLTANTTANPSFGSLRTGFGGPGATAGEGVALRTWTNFISIDENPVIEATVKIPQIVPNAQYLVGFFGDAPAGNIATIPTHTIAFVASSTNTWIALSRRSNVETRFDTGVATSTRLQRLRIEVSANDAKFYIDNAHVGTISGAASLPSPATNLAPAITVSTLVAGNTTTRQFDIGMIRVWVDDPPGGYPSETSTEFAMAVAEEDEEAEYDAIQGAALATSYLTEDPWEFKDGDIVSLDTDGGMKVSKSKAEYDGGALGVISNEVSQLLGVETKNTVRVAMSGRAKVNAHTGNGEIAIGDYVTTSALAGAAMKATESGFVIGRALTPLRGNDEALIVELNPHYEDMGETKLRIAAMEAMLAASTTVSTTQTFTGSLFAAVLSHLSDLGATITQGVAKFAHLMTDTFTVGSSAKPAGITLFDEVTGEPYCLKIKNGRTTTERGECTVVAESENEISSDGEETITDEDEVVADTTNIIEDETVSEETEREADTEGNQDDVTEDATPEVRDEKELDERETRNVPVEEQVQEGEVEQEEQDESPAVEEEKIVEEAPSEPTEE